MLGKWTIQVARFAGLLVLGLLAPSHVSFGGHLEVCPAEVRSDARAEASLGGAQAHEHHAVCEVATALPVSRSTGLVDAPVPPMVVPGEVRFALRTVPAPRFARTGAVEPPPRDAYSDRVGLLLYA